MSEAYFGTFGIFMIIKMLISAFGNAALAIILYSLEKKTSFRKISYKLRQIIYGIIFGPMAVYASTIPGGVDIGDGTIMNVRDTAPLCAGLILFVILGEITYI